MTDAGITKWERARAARDWWQRLQPIGPDGKPNPTADRAALARLRRGASDEALTEEATFALYRALRCNHSAALPRVAILASVLAHVRKDIGSEARSFAEHIGRKTFGEEKSALVNKLRFRRLLLAREEAEIAREFRRAVALADRSAPVRDLASVILSWDRDETRRRFAYDYYAAGSAAPADTTEAHS